MINPMQPMSRSPQGWALRTVPSELVERYVAEGWWTDRSIGQTVAEKLAAKAGAEFVVHSAVRPWRGTMLDIDRAARAFAASLRARGVGAGDVVAYQLPNWVEAGAIFWGAAYVGAVVVPVVHFYGAKELAYILEVTRPKVVVTADRFGRLEYLEPYESLLADGAASWLVVGDTPQGGLPSGAAPFAPLLDADPIEAPMAVDPDSPAVIAFTSGTTRDPKGVIHSHRTIGFEAHQLAGLNPTGPPAITGAPLGHFMGMLQSLLCSLYLDRSVHIVDVWDPGEVLRLMLAEGVGMAGGSSYFLMSLLDHPDFTEAHAASMPSTGLGGASIPIAVTERAARLGIRTYRSYGSTEHPSVTGSTIDEPASKRERTDGRPMLGVDLRVEDDGQILTRGPELFLGYTDAELTAQVFESDGWYRTGDVGVLDDDGYLTITDRISDVIIRGGENISAVEVEDLLLGLESVAEVSVVAAPDDRFGERAAAIVRVREGMTAPTLPEVQAHLGSVGLAKQKWPEILVEVAEFPRTPSGKVQKFKLRQQLREGQLGR
jgi:acyl-CoA synthetase